MFLLMLLAPLSAAHGPEGAGAGLAIGLKSPKSDYLLGEPVLLDLEVKNASDGPISLICIPKEEIECVCVQISGAAGAFRDLTQGVPGFIPGLPIVLEKGDAQFYRLTVLESVGDVSRQEPEQFVPPGPAFARAGEYRVRVAFPLRRRGAATDTLLESNIATIRVGEPEGEREVAIRDRLNSREIRPLLRRAGDSQVKPTTAAYLMETYQQSIGTRYEASVGRILRRIGAWRNLAPGDDARFRELLGLPGPRDPFWRFFPNDERLDREVALDGRRETTVAGLLRELSLQAEINLEAEAIAAEIPWRAKGVRGPLRGAMQEIAGAFRGRWMRKDLNGYTLFSPLDFRREGPARLPMREALGAPAPVLRMLTIDDPSAAVPHPPGPFPGVPAPHGLAIR